MPQQAKQNRKQLQLQLQHSQNHQNKSSPYLRRQLTIKQNNNDNETIETIETFVPFQLLTQKQTDIQQLFFINDERQLQRQMGKLHMLQIAKCVNSMELQQQNKTKTSRRSWEKCRFQNIQYIKSAICSMVQNQKKINDKSSLHNGNKIQLKLDDLQQVQKISQIKMKQFLTYKQVLERSELICKQTEYLKLKYFLVNSEDGQKIRNKIQFKVNNKRICFEKQDEIHPNCIQKFKNLPCIIEQEKNAVLKNQDRSISISRWNMFALEVIRFLLKFYESFKKSVGFYPPKLRLKYILYEETHKTFRIDPAWAINWAFGVIQQPMTYQQKLTFTEIITPKQDNETNNYSKRQDKLKPKLQKQLFNPLIYINSFKQNQKKQQHAQRVQQQQHQQEDKKTQQTLKKILFQSEFAQLKETAKKVLQIENFQSESQTLSSKLKHIEKEKLDEILATYNLMMTIYNIFQLKQFDIKEFVRKVKVLPEDKTFSEMKIDLFCEFVQNSELHLNLIKQLFVWPNNFYSGLKTINSISLMVTEYQKYLQNKIKTQPINFLSLIKNICYPKSQLFESSHNAVRYIITYLLGVIFQIQRKIEHSFIQFQQKLQNKDYQIQETKGDARSIIDNIDLFKKKSFQKLVYYKQNRGSMIENNKIVSVTGRKIFAYIQKINQIDLQKQEITQLRKILEKCISQLVIFLNDFIFNSKMLKLKEYQINFEYSKQTLETNRQNNNIQIQKQKMKKIQLKIIGFVHEAIYINFFILKIFNEAFSKPISLQRREYKICSEQIEKQIEKIIRIQNQNGQYTQLKDFKNINQQVQIILQKQHIKYNKDEQKLEINQIVSHKIFKQSWKISNMTQNLQHLQNNKNNKIQVDGIHFFGLNLIDKLQCIIEGYTKISTNSPNTLFYLNIWKQLIIKQTAKTQQKAIIIRHHQEVNSQTKVPQQSQYKLKLSQYTQYTQQARLKVQQAQKQSLNKFQNKKQKQKLSLNLLIIQDLKKKACIYITIIKNICYTESKLMNSAHNAVRYILAYMVSSLFRIQLKIKQIQLQTKLEFEFEFEEFQRVCTFNQRAFEKIQQYKQKQTEMIQNNKIVVTKAKLYVDFIQNSVQKSFANNGNKSKSKQIDDLVLLEKQLIQNLIKFIHDFILNLKMLKYKELQINFINNSNKQSKKQNSVVISDEEHIRGFLLETIILNYSMIYILNQTVEFARISKYNQKSKSRFDQFALKTNGNQSGFQIVRDQILFIGHKQKQTQQQQHQQPCLQFQKIYQEKDKQKIKQLMENLLQKCAKLETNIIKSKHQHHGDALHKYSFFSLCVITQIKQILSRQSLQYLKNLKIWKAQLKQKQKQNKHPSEQQTNAAQSQIYERFKQFQQNKQQLYSDFGEFDSKDQNTKKQETKQLQSQKNKYGEIQQNQHHSQLQLKRQISQAIEPQQQQQRDQIQRELQEFAFDSQGRIIIELLKKRVSSKKQLNRQQKICQIPKDNSQIVKFGQESQDLQVQQVQYVQELYFLQKQFYQIIFSLWNPNNSFLVLFHNIDRYLMVILFSELYDLIKNSKINRLFLQKQVKLEEFKKNKTRLSMYKNKAIKKIQIFTQTFNQQISEKSGNRYRIKQKYPDIFKYAVKVVRQQFQEQQKGQKNQVRQQKLQEKQQQKHQQTQFQQIKDLMAKIVRISTKILFHSNTMQVKGKQMKYNLHQMDKKKQNKNNQHKQSKQNYLNTQLNKFKFQMILLNFQFLDLFSKINKFFIQKDQNQYLNQYSYAKMYQKMNSQGSLGYFVDQFFKIQKYEFPSLQQKQQKSEKCKEYYQAMTQYCQNNIQSQTDFDQNLTTFIQTLMLREQAVAKKMNPNGKIQYFGMAIRGHIEGYINSHQQKLKKMV